MPSERVQRRIDAFLDQPETALSKNDWRVALARARAALSLGHDDENAKHCTEAAKSPWGDTMDSKELFRKLYREYDRRKRLPIEFYAPDFVAHLPGVPPLDLKAFEDLVGGMFDAFPDMLHDVEDLVVEADRVAVRATLRGTHRGPFLGVPASGETVAIPVCALFRVADGKLVEEWGVIDQTDLVNQMKVGSTRTSD